MNSKQKPFKALTQDLTRFNQWHPTLAFWKVVIAIALFLLLFSNTSLWKSVSNLLESQHPWIFLGSMFVVLLAFFTLLVTLISFKPVFKPLAIAMLMISASAAYFMDNYATLIDKEMVRNVLQTDTHEVTELLNSRLFFTIFLLGVLPSYFLLKTHVRYPTFLKGILVRVGMVATCLAVIVGVILSQYQTFSSFGRNHREVRHLINPANYIFSVKSLLMEKANAGELIIEPIEDDAKLKTTVQRRTKPSLVILVLGETARAANFSLNGYERETNPLLKKESILNFTQTSSCGTATAVSVPCMFQKFTRNEYSDSKGKTHQGLLDVLDHAGVKVLWRDNNSGCKGACDRIETENLSHATIPELCNDKECMDMVLLHGLQSYIDKQTEDVVLVLHQKGNHGPAYYQRYPEAFERFKPVCKTNQLQSCSNQEIRNAYDNAILYTDYFLSQTLQLLKANAGKYNTAMLYMSDHGESLGENNLYLHGMPYRIAPDYQKHVPFIAWLSEGYEQTYGINKQCLENKQNDKLSHDNLFSSMLGLLDVQTMVYDEKLDIFSSCREVVTLDEAIK